MAERTEAQKAEDLFEKRLAEQREAHEHQINLTVKLYEVRIHEQREAFEERKKELLAQNDGLLGAVGHLHGENEPLRQQVAKLEPALVRAKEDLERSRHEMEYHTQELTVRLEEEVKRARLAAEVEVRHLKEELTACRGRKRKA